MTDETAGRPNAPAEPHFAWYLAHVVLGVISGLVVYVLYKENNHAAARRHLIFSVIIWVIGSIAIIAIPILFGWDMWLEVGDDVYPELYNRFSSI